MSAMRVLLTRRCSAGWLDCIVLENDLRAHQTKSVQATTAHNAQHVVRAALDRASGGE